MAPTVCRAADRLQLGTGASGIHWVLTNDNAGAAVAGPRALLQMQSYRHALDCSYDCNDERTLSTLCKAGQMATAGHTDPRRPVTGRITG